jgi:hypothetical protein
MDDDFTPDIGSEASVMTEDFESGLPNWSVSGNGTTNFAIGDAAAASSDNWSANGNISNFIFVNDDACNCDMSNERLQYNSPLDLSNANSASLNFDIKYLDSNDQYASDAFVQTSIDNGSTWQNVGSEILTSSNWSSQSVDLSFVLGQSNVLISFHYNDLGNWAYAMALDNISVTTLGEATVQTEVNTSTNTNLFLLNGQGTMYAYDSITGGIMSSLTNNNNNDNYECSSVQVSTSGTGGMFFNGSSGSDLAMEKTYNIGVTTDNANGDVTVTFYFTEAEIAGWENAVSAAGGSYTRDLLYLNRKPRNGLQEIVPTTVGSYNGEVTLTANLTSLNGDYTFAPLKVLSSGDDNLINFSVYPNPTQDIINIQSLLDFDSVELYSITGKKINTIKNNDNMRSMQIDMSSLNIGIYFIKIQQSNNNLTSVLKIIKN